MYLTFNENNNLTFQLLQPEKSFWNPVNENKDNFKMTGTTLITLSSQIEGFLSSISDDWCAMFSYESQIFPELVLVSPSTIGLGQKHVKPQNAREAL